MRKLLSISLVIIIMLTGCSNSSPQERCDIIISESIEDGEINNNHTVEFVESKNIVKDGEIYIGLFFDYTNNSNETSAPEDFLEVMAFQNGVELVRTVYNGQRIENAVQCDTNIQAGTTTRVVWLFKKDDNSKVSVEVSDGQKFTVE